ncbi:MAG TPA: hypothetical protein VFZ58_04215 [Candidatus Saccharimonadales bacterium]
MSSTFREERKIRKRRHYGRSRRPRARSRVVSHSTDYYPPKLKDASAQLAIELYDQIVAVADEKSWGKTQRQLASQYIDLLAVGKDKVPTDIDFVTLHTVKRRYVHLRNEGRFRGLPEVWYLTKHRFGSKLKALIQANGLKEKWPFRQETLAIMYANWLLNEEGATAPSQLDPAIAQKVQRRFALCYHLFQSELNGQTLPNVTCEWFFEASKRTAPIARRILKEGS